MSAPRLRISKTLRERMNYAKAAGPGLRMLVLESRYWLDSACGHAAAEIGWQTTRVPVVAAGLLPRDSVAELLTALVETRPDFVLTINHSGMDRAGLFANLFADLGVPFVTWFVDDPRTILMNDVVHAATTSVALTWERAYIPYLRELGFEHVHHLPLAADTRFRGVPAATRAIPGAFVGNSMVEFAERQRIALNQYPALAAALDSAFERGDVTRETFALGLAAIVGDSLNAALDEEARRHGEMYCFVEGTRRLRRELASALSPEGLLIRGDEHWRTEFPQAGPPVNYERDLADFYRTCGVNVNSTSIQMATAVNQRVFDCPAAGGFLLTDAQEDMSTLFEPGVDAETYRDLDECVDKFRFYTCHPEARLPIVRAAQQRVQDRHTYRHRLETIAGWIKDRFGD